MDPALMEWAFDMHKKAWDESFKQWNRLMNCANRHRTRVAAQGRRDTA